MDNWTPIARVYDPLKAGSIDGTDTEPHDHGIVRAMRAHYKPNNLVVGEAKYSIFVARLNPETSQDTLKTVFSKYGKVVQCRLVRDIITGISKCYGFVEYKDSHGAAKAWRDAHRVILDNHEIFVDYECERTLKGWIPRRLGGGFGGKKESGQLRFGGRHRPFKKPILITSMERNLGSNRPYSDNRRNSIRENSQGQPWKNYHERRDDDRFRNDREKGYKHSKYNHY